MRGNKIPDGLVFPSGFYTGGLGPLRRDACVPGSSKKFNVYRDVRARVFMAKVA